MVRMTVRVSGRVQMVGYRMFTEMTAARIGGIGGTVRNLPDGYTVEVIAEGRRVDLEALLDELRNGPAHALVRNADVEWGAASGAFTGFETVY